MLTWNTTTGDAGNYTITFNVTDGNGGYDSVTMLLEVLTLSAGNNPPLLDPLTNVFIREGMNVVVDVNATDVDNDTLTFGTNATLFNMSFDPSTGLFAWATQPGDAGTYVVEFNVSDGNGGYDSDTVVIDVAANNPPVLQTVGNWTVTEGQQVLILLVATDADNDSLTYSTNTTLGSFDSVTGIFNWTSAGAGNHTIEFSVSDGFGGVDSEAIVIEVLSASTVPIANASADVTTGIAPLTVHFSGSVTDGDGAITYRWDFDGDGSFDSSLQNATYVYSIPGTYNASLNVTDADGDSTVDQVVIDVLPAVHGSSVDSIIHDKVSTTTYLDDVLDVQSQVTNIGNVQDTIVAELLDNGIVVQTQNVTLSAGVSTVVSFNQTMSPASFHTLTVRTRPLNGETDLTDNLMSLNVEVVSVDSIVSLATREIFFNSTSVGVGGNVRAYLPVQNLDSLKSYSDLLVTLTGATGFNVIPSSSQLVMLPAGTMTLVTWDMNAVTLGSYGVGASEGNDEVIIPSKQVDVI